MAELFCWKARISYSSVNLLNIVKQSLLSPSITRESVQKLVMAVMLISVLNTCHY